MTELSAQLLQSKPLVIQTDRQTHQHTHTQTQRELELSAHRNNTRCTKHTSIVSLFIKHFVRYFFLFSYHFQLIQFTKVNRDLCNS